MAWMQGDTVIWMVFICLLMISVVEVYSASSTMSYGGKSSYWAPVMQHCSFWLVGVAAAWIVSRVPCNYFKLGGTLGLLLAFFLQLLALTSGPINGAGRWLRLWGLSFQPSEFTKISLVTYVAFIFATMRDDKGVSPLGTKMALGGIVFALLLIVTENLSTAALIFLIMLCMAFIAQVRTKLLAIVMACLMAVVTAGMVFAYQIPDSTLEVLKQTDNKILHRVPTWVNRIREKHEIPQNPKDYDITDNVQVTHAHIAVATSHVIGKGPGKSRQRDFLPQAYSDFIYAIIIEEMGIIGSSLVVFLYIVLLFRTARIANRCENNFPAFLAMGIALLFVVQATFNMMVAVGLAPVTGQPLPLISKGGTSCIINGAYIGILLSVSRSAKKRLENAVNVKQLT